MGARANSLFEALASAKPGSAKAAAAKAELEHAISAMLADGGIRAVERLVASLKKPGVELELVAKGAGRRAWKFDVAGGKREIGLIIARNRHDRLTGVQFQEKRIPPRLSPKQRALHALQEAFYARYSAVAQKAYGTPRYRPRPDERLLLLVGDLEGGVNNGGFDTYLLNKGPRIARAAMAALREIGAGKTARMLERAMAPGVTEAQRAALDDRFYAVPEDLAVLTARHLGLATESG